MLTRIAMLMLTPVLGTFALFRVADLRMNTSVSLPVGIYMVSPKGNLVEFCPGDQGLSAGRHYRARGVCPDGAAPLLKPIAATPGDHIAVSSAGVAVNGSILPNTAPLSRDSEGPLLTHWPFGSYALRPGSLWVASSYSPRSYDSRYLGPVPEGSVRARLRPLMVW